MGLTDVLNWFGQNLFNLIVLFGFAYGGIKLYMWFTKWKEEQKQKEKQNLNNINDLNNSQKQSLKQKG